MKTKFEIKDRLPTKIRRKFEDYFNKISKDPFLKYMKGFKFRKNTKRDPQFIYEFTHKFNFFKES